MVHDQPLCPLELRMGAFREPAFGQYDKSPGVRLTSEQPPWLGTYHRSTFPLPGWRTMST